MTYDSSNIFAKILRKEIVCDTIYEDDDALSFYDLYPKAKIHALLIPKGAFENAYVFHHEATSKQIIGFYKALNKVIEILGIEESGFKLISNAGVNGGQEVPHYHVHILGGQRVD